MESILSNDHLEHAIKQALYQMLCYILCPDFEQKSSLLQVTITSASCITLTDNS